MSASVQHMEEATHIASEYLDSLANLPEEISHITAEIRYREARSQDLAQEIAIDSSKYVRHSLRSQQSSPSSPTVSSRSLTPSSARFASLSQKISQNYLEIDKLADEKIVLAQRIITLINTARSRLECDLNKVSILQGEPIEIATPTFSSDSPFLRNNSLGQVNDILRASLNDPPSPGPNALKRRRTASTVIKMPSPAPQSAPPPLLKTGTGNYPRSRLSRQMRHSDFIDDSMDAEGEDYFEGEPEEPEDDQEDNNIYCTCRKKSFGDMIACDNKQCEIQWFHLGCVGLTSAPPDQTLWYCPTCRLSKLPQNGRKNRKKHQ